MLKLQTSTDRKQWSTHDCAKVSRAHKPVTIDRVFHGYACVQIIGYQVQDPPEEGQTVYVRTYDDETGDIEPVQPLAALVKHTETSLRNAPEDERGSTISTVVFDGESVSQV